jgi:hypothetical protein
MRHLLEFYPSLSMNLKLDLRSHYSKLPATILKTNDCPRIANSSFWIKRPQSGLVLPAQRTKLADNVCVSHFLVSPLGLLQRHD